MTLDTPASTYQLKVTLQGSKPSIWRRILVPASMNLLKLHHTLQIVMGWQDEHLHEFIHKKRRYGIPDVGYDDGTIDELEIPLGELLKKEGDALVYLYDFGDGWRHEVMLEKVRPSRVDEELPRCTAGARACPPEDVGGVHGYERLLKILRKPSHEEYEDMLEWVGDDFDPRSFDKEAVNDELSHAMVEDIFAGIEEELAAIADEPLSAEESELIDRYFPDQGNVTERLPTYHGLNGFLTAIISSPIPTFPGDWLEELLATYEIEVSQEGEMQALLVALFKFNNLLAVALEDGEPFLPNSYDLDAEPPGTSPMELWCDGFLRGFIFNEDDWYDLDNEDAMDEVEACAAIISALAMRELDDKTLPPEEFREKMALAQNALPGVVISLYEMARSELYAHLDEPFQDAFEAMLQQPAVSTKVGRNEPCPCGSGKKYKKCCGDKPAVLH